MKKYKLIKEYPGSPSLGFILDKTWEVNYPLNYYLINGLTFNPNNHPEFWELVIEKDYEILSYITDTKTVWRKNVMNNTYFITNNFGLGLELDILLSDKYNGRIHSIKRLSDGEIFTIGDNIEIRNLNSKIDGFYIKNDYLMITSDLSNCGDYLKNIKKIKKPLFTTEDGVDIYKGDIFYYVKFKQYNNTLGKPFEIVKGNHPAFKYEPQYEKYFSTKEKAEEYILLNKPCLSLNDIFKNVEEMRKGLKTFENSQLAKRFKKLVKQKLNK